MWRTLRCLVLLALALLQLGLAREEHHGGVHYGPKKCVSLTRSNKGTCVLNTHCLGLAEDLAHFDFAFVCDNLGQKKQMHSFGFGGFEEVEEFDTAVECAKCDKPPAEHPQNHGAMHLSAQRSNNATKGDEEDATPRKNETSKGSEDKTPGDMKDGSQVVRYGPGNCVSTYESKSGTCIVSTNCDATQLNESWTDYEFGLVCIEKDGAPVRHLFGKNSFDPVEKFDTLIQCSQCLGLDHVVEDADLAKEVAELGAEVKNMTKDMKELRGQVQKLNKAVGIKHEGAKDDAVEPAEADAVNSFVAHRKKSSASLRSGKKVVVAKGKKVARHKKSKKHGTKKTGQKYHANHHNRRQKEEEEDGSEADAEDQEEEEGQDEEEDDQEEDESAEEDEDEEVEPAKEELEASSGW